MVRHFDPDLRKIRENTPVFGTVLRPLISLPFILENQFCCKKIDYRKKLIFLQKNLVGFIIVVFGTIN